MDEDRNQTQNPPTTNGSYMELRVTSSIKCIHMFLFKQF